MSGGASTCKPPAHLMKHQCPDAIRLLSESTRREMACAGEQWRESLVETLEAMYNQNMPNRTERYSQPIEPSRHRRFDAMLPVVVGACNMSRFGSGDSAKLLCGLEQAEPCTVISIGTRYNVLFELDVIRKTNCRVEMLDCTVPRCSRRGSRWHPDLRRGRARYHEVCIGASDSIQNSTRIRSDWAGSSGSFSFRKYSSIMAGLNIKSLTAIKVCMHEPKLLANLLSRRGCVRERVRRRWTLRALSTLF